MNDLRDNYFNAPDAAPQGKRLAAIRDLENKASEISASLNAVYAELGEKYYSEHKDALSESGYSEIIERIELNLDKLSEIKSELERLDSDSVCKNCGHDLKDGVAFCPICGLRVNSVDRTGACIRCGKLLEEGAQFCVLCGTPVYAGVIEKVSEVVPDAPAAPEEAPAPEPEANICPQCGKQLRPGAGFCSGCGCRINS